MSETSPIQNAGDTWWYLKKWADQWVGDNPFRKEKKLKKEGIKKVHFRLNFIF